MFIAFAALLLCLSVIVHADRLTVSAQALTCENKIISGPTSGRSVRFRGGDLRMHRGQVLSVDSDQQLIESEGKTYRVPTPGVFSDVADGRVFTPSLDYWFMWTRFDLTPPLVRFLGEAARVLSTSRERGDDTPTSLRAVLDLLNARLTYDEAVAKHAPDHIEDVLRSRRAGCLQFAMLTAAILAEAGYETHLVTVYPEGRAGHVWLEVFDHNAKGHPVTYIVDGAGTSVVMTRGEASAKAFVDRHDAIRAYYLNADREYHGVE